MWPTARPPVPLCHRKASAAPLPSEPAAFPGLPGSRAYPSRPGEAELRPRRSHALHERAADACARGPRVQAIERAQRLEAAAHCPPPSHCPADPPRKVSASSSRLRTRRQAPFNRGPHRATAAVWGQEVRTVLASSGQSTLTRHPAHAAVTLAPVETPAGGGCSFQTRGGKCRPGPRGRRLPPRLPPAAAASPAPSSPPCTRAPDLRRLTLKTDLKTNRAKPV